MGLCSRLRTRPSRMKGPTLGRSGQTHPDAGPCRSPPPAGPDRTPLPAGRLKKRLRAAWRWWQTAGLLSLLWPFFQRFNLAEAPEGSFPERPMSTKFKGPAARDAATRGETTWVLGRLRFLFLWRHFRPPVRYHSKTVNIRLCLSSGLRTRRKGSGICRPGRSCVAKESPSTPTVPDHRAEPYKTRIPLQVKKTNQLRCIYF